MSDAAQTIADALAAIHAAYWAACDAEARAIDPVDLDAPEGILDADFDAALQVEAIAAARGIGWHAARQFL